MTVEHICGVIIAMSPIITEFIKELFKENDRIHELKLAKAKEKKKPKPQRRQPAKKAS